MLSWQEERLLEYRPDLASRINLNVDLWNELRSKGIVTESDEEEIKLNRTKREQISSLLDHLLKGKDTTYDTFCACLRRTNQGHIVDKYLAQIEPSTPQNPSSSSAKGDSAEMSSKAVDPAIYSKIIDKCRRALLADTRITGELLAALLEKDALTRGEHDNIRQKQHIDHDGAKGDLLDGIQSRGKLGVVALYEAYNECHLQNLAKCLKDMAETLGVEL